MDTPATSRKRPASSFLNTEARQPIPPASGPLSASRSMLSPHSPPSLKLLHKFKVSVVEWQCKNKASIYRTAQHLLIERGCNRERKCRIPRISPPPALCTKAKVAKGGLYLWDTTVLLTHSTSELKKAVLGIINHDFMYCVNSLSPSIELVSYRNHKPVMICTQVNYKAWGRYFLHRFTLKSVLCTLIAYSASL